MAHLHGAGLAPGTAKGYLAVVRYTQIGLGLGDPHIGDMPQLEYMVKELKRTYRPVSSRTRLPITPATSSRSLGVSAEPTGCLHAVGGSMHVLLRLSPGGGSGHSI